MNLTNSARVKSLYKKAIRTLEDWYDRREVFRYHAILMRERFDENKCAEQEEAGKLVSAGELEWNNKKHWHSKKFPSSPGGTAYAREVIPPDWVLDYWHPLEKAQYPNYFKTREERKIEYVKFYKTLFPDKKDKEPISES